MEKSMRDIIYSVIQKAIVNEYFRKKNNMKR